MSTESGLKKCPYCSKYLLSQRAVICIHCGRNVATGEAIPTKITTKAETKIPVDPKVKPEKVPVNTSPGSFSRKAIYAAKLIGAITLLIFAGVYILKAYNEYKAQESANIGSPGMSAASNFIVQENAATVLQTGKATETREIADEAATEAMSKKIAEYKLDSPSAYMPKLTVREINVSLSGSVRFDKAEDMQPLRIKIYRSAATDGKYSLIYNELLSKLPKPTTLEVVTHDITESASPLAGQEKSGGTVKRSQYTSRQAVASTAKKPAETRNITETVSPPPGQEKTAGPVTRSEQITVKYEDIPPTTLNFKVTDVGALDCGSNNVFYKIKFCSESGLMLIESNPLKAPLVSPPILEDDLKTWTWTPFFPGKDPLDGCLMDGRKKIPVSNAPVKGQLATAMPKQLRFQPPVSFTSAAWNRSWHYSRQGRQSVEQNSEPDKIAVKPVFSGERFFDVKGQIELKSLKIDGRKVFIQTDSSHIENSKLPRQRVLLNYPGTPVAELEFAYGGRTNTLRTQLPPVPTGLQARTLEDGSVKLTWDPLADRIDRKQFIVPPDIKLLRYNTQHNSVNPKNFGFTTIHTCDIKQTEFIDKQTEPGHIYTYSIVLDNANAKVESWTKDKGIAEVKTMLKDLANPFWDNSKATVYTYQEKPPVRPVRISFWEPALCYERTGSPGMQLFAAAVRKLGQNAEFEVLDRTSRNNVIEEKILTMSYEKSIMIKTLPADFTVLVRDYSRQQGNGVELWLIQNKTFDYEKLKLSKSWEPPTFRDSNFLAWRIGSISADELKIPEKAEAFGDRLVAEINRRVFFKSTTAPKDASAPTRFVFNPLETIRQKIMVVENTAIGESIMIGLSNQLPGCNIMTRDNWRAIFNEQNLMREQGENLADDISGTVLISGWVWRENNKKQYLFNLTDIKSGICIGSLQCSGTIEEVAAQLAGACKKVKPAISRSSASVEQSKSELILENWKIRDCFNRRFGLSRAEKAHKILNPDQEEMDKPAFAGQQWQLGNRENALKILEEMWKTDKSAWHQLRGYHCMMGNYPRALQIVETMMQQKKAANTLIPEYCRLRAMIAGNAQPAISSVARYEVGQASSTAPKDTPAQKKRRNRGATVEDYYNKTFDEDYFWRMSDRGMEWNPGGECRTMIKRQFDNGLKFEEWIKDNAVQNWGTRINIFENIEKNKTWRSDAMWESVPLFGNDDTMAWSRSVKLFGGGEPSVVSGEEKTNEIEQEPFSMVRAFFAMVKNPYVKLIPVAEHGSGYNDDEYDKAAAECDSGYKFLELYFKKIMRTRKNNFGRINLRDMICIEIMTRLDNVVMARRGNADAQDILLDINAADVSLSFEKYGNYEPYDLLAFKIYRGDRDACELALKKILKDNCNFGSNGTMKDIYYLMAKAGRKEMLAAILKANHCDAIYDIAVIRWGDPKMLKSLLLEHSDLFESQLFFYLIDGLNDPDLCEILLQHRMILGNFDQDYQVKSVLWLGKPLTEIYREQTLNYKKGK